MRAVCFILAVCVGHSLAGRGYRGGRGGVSSSEEEYPDDGFPVRLGRGFGGGFGGTSTNVGTRSTSGNNGLGNSDLAELRRLAANMSAEERNALLELFLSGELNGCPDSSSSGSSGSGTSNARQTWGSFPSQGQFGGFNMNRPPSFFFNGPPPRGGSQRFGGRGSRGGRPGSQRG